MKQKVTVIGAGFGGLASAALLAKYGFDVRVLEKHSIPGGRARIFEEKGFKFDMGPSWYMMADTFETFFKLFDKKVSDYYELERLDPAYRIFFKEDKKVDIVADNEKNIELFESFEKGAGGKLKKYLKKSEQKYTAMLSNLMYDSYTNLSILTKPSFLKTAWITNLFGNYHKEIKNSFKNPILQKIIEWEVVFVGCSPENAPAIFTMISHASMNQGIFYPKGGVGKVVEGLHKLCMEMGVKFEFNQNVTDIQVENGSATKIKTTTDSFDTDIVLANSDYHFTETQLLEEQYRSYKEDYWDKQTLSPSCLLFYLGVDAELPNLIHHNYFFDESWDGHFNKIFDKPDWPEDPLLYICATSKSDPEAAPKGNENLFVLIPIAPDLEDNEELREKYLKYSINKIKKYTGVDISDKIVVQKSYCINDFKDDYNAYKGHAFGTANTLFQTAIFRSSMKSKKIDNLYYTGCMTHPGVGMPTSLVSGQIVADLINKKHV